MFKMLKKTIEGLSSKSPDQALLALFSDIVVVDYSD